MTDRKVAQELLRQLEKVKNIQNAVDAPHYNTEQAKDIQVNIEVDNSIEHGLFKPHPEKTGTWLASEQTFRAMKKNIFALDEEMLDLADNIICESCKKTVDKQFWFFCPYCGASYK
jgi:hypothetical protein